MYGIQVKPAMKIGAVVLTKNEERHIARCLESILRVVDAIVVVDSFSTDRTREIAEGLGAVVHVRAWRNYADQFAWGVLQLPQGCDWVLRIDADEYLDPLLAQNIEGLRTTHNSHNVGYVFQRVICFLGKPMRYGGVFPGLMLRLYKRVAGGIEQRWMDEHIRVDGPVAVLSGELVDNNLNPLSWWVEKHNSYASREALDILVGAASADSMSLAGKAKYVRFLKQNVYLALPLGLRAAIYWFYRYFLRYGILDGLEGMIYHFLQAGWYRFLVDAKVAEVRLHMKRSGVPLQVAIKECLGFSL